jgi:Cu/Ag efflux protein CusF
MAATSIELSTSWTRRRGAGMLLVLVAASRSSIAGARALVEVWKSPSCGGCKDWVRHLEANGFSVLVHDVGNAAVRSGLAIPVALGSCHTAKVGPYAIECHGPAREVHRLLANRPDAIGLAVPGMPIGSPGMEGPEYGPRRESLRGAAGSQGRQHHAVSNLSMKETENMNTQLKSLIAALALALMTPLAAMADDAHHKTAEAAGAASADMTDGEVRKIDMEGGKITLKHADIKSLDMPGMTMVFVVKDKAVLDKLKAGDKVKFKAINDAGKFTVTEIQPVR